MRESNQFQSIPIFLPDVLEAARREIERTAPGSRQDRAGGLLSPREVAQRIGLRVAPDSASNRAHFLSDVVPELFGPRPATRQPTLADAMPEQFPGFQLQENPDGQGLDLPLPPPLTEKERQEQEEEERKLYEKVRELIEGWNVRKLRGLRPVTVGKSKEGGAIGFRVTGDVVDCKWIQFARNQLELLVKDKDGNASWQDASDLGQTLNLSGNGGGQRPPRPARAGVHSVDNKTEYVDANGSAGVPNEPGYVESGGKAGRDNNGSTSKAMEDQPEVSNPGAVVSRAQDADKNRQAKDQKFQAVYGIRVTFHFTTYLICNGTVVCKIRWHYVLECIGETAKKTSDIGMPADWTCTESVDTENIEEPGAMDDVHKRALQDYENGGRNGAQ